MQSPVKLAATKALAAAIVAILVVAGLAVAVSTDGGADDEATLDTLLTAAEATETVGSADVEVVGDAHTAVKIDLEEFLSEIPDLDAMIDRLDAALPPELPEIPAPSTRNDGQSREPSRPGPPDRPGLPQAPGLPDIPAPDCDGVPSDVCDELRRQLDDARRRLEGSLSARGGAGLELPDGPRLPEGFGGPEGSEFDPGALRERMLEKIETQRAAARQRMRRHLAEAQERFEKRLAEIPDEFRCDFHFEGSGSMSIPGTVEIGGEADVSCDPDFVDGSGHFDTLISQDVAFDANGDGTYTAVPRSGMGAALAADGKSIADLLRKAENADDGGTDQLDGVEVRHVSFSVDEGPVTFSADVWIGVEDHVVRKLVTRSSGQVDHEGINAEFQAEHTVLVSNVQIEGSTAEIEIPDFEDVAPAPPAAQQFETLTNPFGDALPSATFGSEVSAS